MIGEAIRSILATDAGVAGVVGGRIYPVRAAQRRTRPYITYQQVSGPRAQSMEGANGLSNPRMQVNCHADTYAAASALADKVRLALDGFNADVDGVRVKALLVNEYDGDDGPESASDTVVFAKSLDFSCWINESTPAEN